MQYCTNCKRLTEEPVCPYCRSTKLRVALDADFCMFAELFYPQAEMLKELLDELEGEDTLVTVPPIEPGVGLIGDRIMELNFNHSA